MPFTQAEIDSAANSTLEFFLDKGQSFAQNIQQKPMLRAFDAAAGTFSGGLDTVSWGVNSGQGGGSLQGYTHDDQVGYYNPANQKRARGAWREHHIGIGLTQTELKQDGILLTEENVTQSTSNKDDREMYALVNRLEQKLELMSEDYAVSMDSLIHGDGTSDPKSLAGLASILLEAPTTGTTFGISRAANSWWRNRARTSANSNIITSSTTGGGELLQVLQKEKRQLKRYAQGGVRHRCFAGSDLIDALERELRANGQYTLRGFAGREAVDGAMATDEGIPFGEWNIIYDPTLDNIGKSKYLYVVDFKRVRLMYMQGERMKKHSPARPYDRYVMYKAVTTTGLMVAQQLNTSGVYQIS